MSYKTVAVPIILRNITNHPITAYAQVAFKHLAFSSSSFSDTGQLTAHGFLHFYRGTELPGMITNATSHRLFLDVTSLQQNTSLFNGTQRVSPEGAH